MNDVVTRHGVKLPKMKWPQDTLRVPDGYGRMSLIGKQNDVSIGREYFTNSGSLTGFPVGNGVSRIINIPVGNDGDFWLTNVVIAVVNTDGVTVVDTQDVTVQLTDSVTGYNVYTPFIHINTLFTPLEGTRVNWNEPMCFFRRSSMIFTFTRPRTATSSCDIYVACHGWKEYGHASE